MAKITNITKSNTSSTTSTFVLSPDNPDNLSMGSNNGSENLTEEEIRKRNYEIAKKNIQDRKKTNQDKIDAILKDPFSKQKEQNKKRQNRIKKVKTKTDQEKKKARQQRTKIILQNAKKTLSSIIALFIVNKLTEIIDQNNKIKKLVDDTNIVIEEANISNNPIKLDNAKTLRDSAIKIIQNNEDKITKVKEQIQKISTYINIFNIVVNVIGPTLLSTPVPSPAPDAVTPPKESFRRKVYEPALRILNTLSALLPIAITLLEKLIQILEDYKFQLLTINGELESKLPPLFVNLGTNYEEYKGFKFALREENNPQFEIRGNKRHYAVAINKQNVEQLKSEASFTLDPDDLIEQLKLVIDRQNLQG